MKFVFVFLVFALSCSAKPLVCSRADSVVKPGVEVEAGRAMVFTQLRSDMKSEGMLGMMVAVGDVAIGPEAWGSKVDSDGVEMKRGYLGVPLADSDVRVEVVAGRSVAAYRYTFLESKEGHVLMDVSRSLDRFQGGEIHLRDDKTYEGVARYRVKGRETPVYFSFQYSKPFRQRGVWKADEIKEGRNQVDADDSVALGAYAYFWTHEGESILMKVGVSNESVEDARAKLAEEFPGWDFNAFREEAERSR